MTSYDALLEFDARDTDRERFWKRILLAAVTFVYLGVIPVLTYLAIR